MMPVKPPATPDEETEQLSRQLASLRRRSRHVAREVGRIRAEMVDLITRIDMHFSSKGRLP